MIAKQMKKRKRILIFVLPVVFFQLIQMSCHPLYCNWDKGYVQLSRIPIKDSIIGTYSLISKSKELLINNGLDHECVLVLMESGKYSIKNVPEQTLNSGKVQWQSFSRDGIWTTSCQDSLYCMIELENVAVLPIARKEEGRISILMTIGDSDECNGIIFERKK
jgi:hypothetical protein